MAARQPLFKVLKVRGRHIKAATIFPALFIVGQIVAHRLLRIIKAQHHLVLVKRPIRVILVHHKHLLPIPPIYIIRHKHIDVIAIHTLRAAEISVSVVHFALPRLSVRIHTTAHTPLRLFDTDIKRPHLHMPLLVVPRLLLCITRVRVHLTLRSCNLRRERPIRTQRLIAAYQHIRRLNRIATTILQYRYRSRRLPHNLTLHDTTIQESAASILRITLQIILSLHTVWRRVQ